MSEEKTIRALREECINYQDEIRTLKKEKEDWKQCALTKEEVQKVQDKKIKELKKALREQAKTLEEKARDRGHYCFADYIKEEFVEGRK